MVAIGKASRVRDMEPCVEVSAVSCKVDHQADDDNPGVGYTPLRIPMRSGSIKLPFPLREKPQTKTEMNEENDKVPQTPAMNGASSKEVTRSVTFDWTGFTASYQSEKRPRASTMDSRVFSVDPELNKKAMRPGSIRDKPAPKLPPPKYEFSWEPEREEGFSSAK